MARKGRIYSNVFVKPNEQSQVYLSYAMARNCRVYSNFHCLFCAKIRKSSDIYDKYGHFFTISSILQRILFVFSQINPLLSPRTLPRHLVCRRKCLSVFQHCRRPAHEGLRLFPRERIFSLSGGKNFFLAREENICLVCTAFSMSPKAMACQAIPVSIPNKACGNAPWQSKCICFCPFCLSTWINVSIPKFQLTWKMQERHIPDKRNIYSSPIRLLTFSP